MDPHAALFRQHRPHQSALDIGRQHRLQERFAKDLRQPGRDKLRARFSEKGLGDLNMAVILTNAWNRIAIPFQSVPGTYRPATR